MQNNGAEEVKSLLVQFTYDFCKNILKYQEDLLVSGEKISADDETFIHKYSKKITEDNEYGEYEFFVIKEIIDQNHREYCKQWTTDEVTPYVFLDRFDDYIETFKATWRNESNNEYALAIVDHMFDLIKTRGEEFKIIKVYVNGFVKESIEKKAEVLEQGMLERLKAQESELHDTYDKKTEDLDKKIQTAKDELNEHTGREELNITKKASETSVTVLGMFSGIIITIVAGLTYLTSVFQNIHTESSYRLIIMSAIIGIVCINLIATLFHFISKNKNSDIHNKNESDKTKHFWKEHFVYISSNIVLIFIVVITIICWMLGVVESRNEIINGVTDENNTVESTESESLHSYETEVPTSDIAE